MRNSTMNELEPFGVMSKKAHVSQLRLCKVNWTLPMWWPQRLGLILWCDSFHKSFQEPKYHKILSQKPSFQRMCVCWLMSRALSEEQCAQSHNLINKHII